MNRKYFHSSIHELETLSEKPKKTMVLNVAVTRAKEVVYVVGNRKLWREAAYLLN